MSTIHRITTTAAVIVSLAAAGASTAAARPAEDPATAANQAPTTVYSRPDKALIPVAAPAATSSSTSLAHTRLELNPSGLTYGEQQAAALGFGGSTYGEQQAAALGSGGSTHGEQQAAALGSGGSTHGEKEAAALGFAGGAVAPTAGSRTDGLSPSGHSPGPTAASSGETFGWGDAGIGAAGMLLLVSAGVGVAIMTRRQRHRLTAS